MQRKYTNKVLKIHYLKIYVFQNLVKVGKDINNINVYLCWDRIDYAEMYT